MSKLKVNELDTESGTTITVTAGKTIAGTDIIDTAQIAADAITATELADNAVSNSQVTAAAAIAVSKLETGNRGDTLFWNAATQAVRLAAGTSGQFLQTQGSGADPVWGSVTEYDDSGLQDDIALLGFRVASNGSLAKYNLVDQTVDDFQDGSGVSAPSSTAESRSASGNYYYGAVSTWETGDRSSTITVTSDANTFYDPASAQAGTAGTNQQLVNGSTTGNNTTASMKQWPNQGVTNRDIRFDLGSAKVVTDAIWYQSTTNGNGTWKWQADSQSSYASAVDVGSSFTLQASGGSAPYTQTWTTELGSNVTAYRYWRLRGVTGNFTAATDQWIHEVEFKVDVEGADMVLVSTTTAAQAAPTKGDIVFTYTNGAGTTTLGTDVTAEISADGGSTWTAMTLGSEGSTGSHNIATAHDVTITSTITSPWNMAYRIKTLNQAVGKTTRIHAVSLGWS